MAMINRMKFPLRLRTFLLLSLIGSYSIASESVSTDSSTYSYFSDKHSANHSSISVITQDASPDPNKEDYSDKNIDSPSITSTSLNHDDHENMHMGRDDIAVMHHKNNQKDLNKTDTGVKYVMDDSEHGSHDVDHNKHAMLLDQSHISSNGLRTENVNSMDMNHKHREMDMNHKDHEMDHKNHDMDKDHKGHDMDMNHKDHDMDMNHKDHDMDMNHKDHDMDMDMDMHMNMSGMMMYFHVRVKETVLFKEWKITTVGGMIGSMIGIFLLGMFYEGLKYFREYLFKQYVSSIQFSTVAVTGESGRVTQVHKVERHHMLSWPHALQTCLHVVQIIMSYFLMLIFMTYNAWLCIAVVLGAGVGYFIFGWKKASVVDITEHCH